MAVIWMEVKLNKSGNAEFDLYISAARPTYVSWEAVRRRCWQGTGKQGSEFGTVERDASHGFCRTPWLIVDTNVSDCIVN